VRVQQVQAPETTNTQQIDWTASLVAAPPKPKLLIMPAHLQVLSSTPLIVPAAPLWCSDCA
jgi:hypothetical protein